MQEDSTEQKKQETEILYNTRSEEAQEIIGKMPHWIIRWGITVMGGFVLLLFVIAASVKYPETISAEIQLSPLYSPVIVSSKADGIIEKLLITDNQFVNKNQQLSVITLDSSGGEFTLIAQANGKAALIKDIKVGMSVHKNEPLIAIISDDGKSSEIMATGIINTGNRKSLSIGQAIDVRLSAYPAETYGMLKGKIYKISPVAIDGYYIFNVAFGNNLITTNNYKINLQDKLTGTGSIIVKDKTILTRLFEKLKAI